MTNSQDVESQAVADAYHQFHGCHMNRLDYDMMYSVRFYRNMVNDLCGSIDPARTRNTGLVETCWMQLD